MIGFGITLPVLVFYIERLALAEGVTSREASVHVGALTGVFALMQVFFAPLWGKLSDRLGRRMLIIVGLGGNAVSLILFGAAKDLSVLYIARILGGIFSSAVLPVASAYVADVTTERERGRGMAWLGSAIGLGVVVGPALGASLSGLEWHLTFDTGHFAIDGFSTPFFAASVLVFATVFVAFRWLPESKGSIPVALSDPRTSMDNPLKPGNRWQYIREPFGKLLGLSFLGQFALALFEGTFALHAQYVMGFGPAEMAVVFMVCGLVMAVAQMGVVGWFIVRIGEKSLLPIGLGFMGVGMGLLMTTQTMALILAYVALFALGMAILSPSLASLVSKRAGRWSGAALGVQNATNSLGQASGPFFGGLMFSWNIHAPYLLAAVPLIGVAFLVGRTNLGRCLYWRRSARREESSNADKYTNAFRR
jgi:DHA1 family multidrug resistance protein-like MFS transporter